MGEGIVSRKIENNDVYGTKKVDDVVMKLLAMFLEKAEARKQLQTRHMSRIF